MLLQIKVYLIAILYFFGALFMLLFPPRNFELSGSKLRTVRSAGPDVKFNEYVDYEMLLAITDQFAREDSEVARVRYLTPKTAGNRSLIAIELHSDKLSNKPGILIIGGLNGMAWGVPNAIIELSEKLLFDANYQTPFFNDYDWYLIPMANPDGFHFTHSIKSLEPVMATEWSRNITARNNTRPDVWLKNVDRENELECFGTNVNRNFPYHWQGAITQKLLNISIWDYDHSKRKRSKVALHYLFVAFDDVFKTPERCSQFYPGTRPFSTAEAQAIRAYVDRLGSNIHLAIHLHASFVLKKEFILYPWRYSLRQHSNSRALQEIGEYAARQARLPDGRLYQVHQGSSDERVAGTLSDYIAGVVGVDLVFIVKPYHQPFPNYRNSSVIEAYVKRAITAVSSVVRGWRSSTKQNTLSFFGRDVEF